MESREERTTKTGQESQDEGASGLSKDEFPATSSQSPVRGDEPAANDTNGIDLGPVHAEDVQPTEPPPVDPGGTG